MDTALDLARETVLDPVVVTSTASVSVLLVTGAAARAIEFVERRTWHRRHRAGTGGTR